jgi:hypothetical protein
MRQSAYFCHECPYLSVAKTDSGLWWVSVTLFKAIMLSVVMLDVTVQSVTIGVSLIVRKYVNEFAEFWAIGRIHNTSFYW